jgi:hypothetical protein
VIGSGRARFLSRGRCRDLGCHHGHELHVGFERQAGHVDDPTGDVLDIGARLSTSPRPVACRRPRAVSSLRLVAYLWPKRTCSTNPSEVGDLAVARQKHYM